jgi:hypothetical protein
MTDEELGMLLAALLQLNRGFKEVARSIVEQEAEIGALRTILEQKGIAPGDELDRAREEAVRRLKEGLAATSNRTCRRLSRRRSVGDRISAA